ncbi:hypothetical protein CJ030_MR0G005899 [Morella rubra]|uniref:Transposase MuDR plant domain-containing protein n=1 Tax=Morella rubra TaxID=262757 RepID=A0A6A1UL47_9ROSI|nr:hypothetical protein CJ030_MR0G005899 [Morella rubra]
MYQEKNVPRASRIRKSWRELKKTKTIFRTIPVKAACNLFLYIVSSHVEVSMFTSRFSAKVLALFLVGPAKFEMCKLERDDSQSDLTPLKCDADVLTTVARILLEGRDTLRIYVEHGTSRPILVPEPDVTENMNEEDMVFHDVLEDRSMTDMGVDAEDIVREAKDVNVNVEDIMRDAEGVNSEGEAVDSDDDIEGDNIEADVSDFDKSDADSELYEYAVQTDESGDDARKASMEWFGQGTKNDVSADEPKIVRSSDDDIMESTSEDNASDEDQPRKRKGTDFREEELEDGTVQLEKGMKFRDLALFKKALALHGIQNNYDYHCLKSDKKRVTAVCALKCSWRIHVSFMISKEAV